MKEIIIHVGQKLATCRLNESGNVCAERVGAAAYSFWVSVPKSSLIEGLFLASSY